jgi:Family of unknown function (DUF6600)
MRALAALLLGGLLAGAAFAYDTVPDPAAYEESLAPYGGWVDDVTYGRAWRPAVEVGWRPYSVGHWDWSPWGWTWVSEEPWGWTYHYGRWVWLASGPWVWVPGVTWGPAWVEWYTGPGWIGWRPLPPFGYRGPSIQQFIFIRDRDFCAPRLHGLFVDHHRLPSSFGRGWGGHGFRPPQRDHVARVSAHPIRRRHDRSPDMLPPHRRPNRGGTFVGRRPEPPRRRGTVVGKRPDPPRARRIDAPPAERPTRRPEHTRPSRVPRVDTWVGKGAARGTRAIVEPTRPRGGVKGWRGRSEVTQAWRPQGGPVRPAPRAGRASTAAAGSVWGSAGGSARASQGSSVVRAPAAVRGHRGAPLSKGGDGGRRGRHSTFASGR